MTDILNTIKNMASVNKLQIIDNEVFFLDLDMKNRKSFKLVGFFIEKKLKICYYIVSYIKLQNIYKI
jgi:hypothetical protein